MWEWFTKMHWHERRHYQRFLTKQSWSNIAERGGSFFVDNFFPDHHGDTAKPAPAGLHFCDDFPTVWLGVVTLNGVVVPTERPSDNVNKN